MLSKTRYVLGCNAVSTLQLPSEDREVDALVSVVSTPVSLQKYDGDIMYQELNVDFLDPIVAVPREGEEDHQGGQYPNTTCGAETDDDPVDGLRRRVMNAEEEPPEDAEENEESSRGNNNANQTKKKTINRDPIRWFSALPPQTLKHAQMDFKNVIQISAKCATLIGQLRAVCNEYRRLSKIKAKIENMEKES